MSEDFNFFMEKIRQGMGLSEMEVTPEQITFDKKGYITIDGRRVILYIRDQVQQFEGRVNQYKFHIVGCSTLKSMLTQNRYARYVVTESTSGVFKVCYIRQNDVIEAETKLHVCKNCLRTLNWQGFKKASVAQKNKIYENFSIAEFFDAVKNDNRKNFSVIPAQKF